MNLFEIPWQHWIAAVSVIAGTVLLRYLWHRVWLWRLGPLHDFDLDNPELVHTGVFHVTEDSLPVAVGPLPASVTFEVTVEGDQDVVIPAGTQIAVSAQETTFEQFRCRRCGKTLGLSRREAAHLPPQMARGCRRDAPLS